MLNLNPTTLRRRREAAGLSQSELAQRIEYRTETLNRYENRKAKIPLAVQIALDNALSEYEKQPA